MKPVGRYDPVLQMFVEELREPDLRRLTFMRWLVEHGRLEHPASGPASGQLTVALAQAEIAHLSLASQRRIEERHEIPRC